MRTGGRKRGGGGGQGDVVGLRAGMAPLWLRTCLMSRALYLTMPYICMTMPLPPCLQVRVIVERLAKRCGFDSVAQHIPAAHSRLLTHIRKAHNRKQRLRSEAGSQVRAPVCVPVAACV